MRVHCVQANIFKDQNTFICALHYLQLTSDGLDAGDVWDEDGTHRVGQHSWSPAVACSIA